jgi:PAS domain S-box-containing protein
MHEATINLSDGAREAISRRGADAIRLVFNILLVGLVCYVGTQLGWALKFPPHHISPLWPTNAILFAVLVVAPIRHWWAYALAFLVSLVINDVLAGSLLSGVPFMVADLIEVFIAAVGVRRFAGGPRAFASFGSVVVYILVAAVLAPFTSAFIGALAGMAESYWFYWRVWFLSDALPYLMLAPAILTWITSARTTFKNISLARCIEACLIGCSLVAISVRVFSWPAADGSVPALVYLPLPFLLWAAVRFGPAGVNTSLLVVAFVSISGAVRGRGPFADSAADDSVLPLQLFLVTMSVPLMLLAALINERRDKEEALRESEERMTLAASAGKLGLWLWDVPGDEIWVGQGRRALFGWAESEPVDFKRFMETVHPEDRERVRASVSWALQGGGDHVVEYRIVLSDGSIRWLVTRARVELDGDGRPARVRGVSIDITERKLIDEALRESQARYSYFIHNTFATIWRFDIDPALSIVLPEDQQIEHIYQHCFLAECNDSCARLYGFPSVEQAIGSRLEDLMPRRKPENMNLLRGFIRSGYRIFEAESVEINQQGQAVRFLNNVVGIVEDGLLKGAWGISRDVTDQHQAIQALKESEERFRTMANTAPVMIWMSGPDKLCSFFNKGWLDFTGRSLEQELGNGWTVGIHPDDFDHCFGVYVNSFDARQEFTMEYRLRRFDAEYCWVLDHGVPRFESDGTFLGYIGTAIDINKRRRTESELQRQRGELAHLTRVSTMGELAASLAHELNQPLTAILSNAQAAQRFLAANPADVEELGEILKDIVQDDSRASEVIQRMRALVKKEDLAFAPLDLGGVVRDVAALVHSDAILQEVRILLEVKPDLPPVRGNKVQLQQVVLNLLLNAFEAMKDWPAHEREVKVHVERDGARMVKVAVRDRGTGLNSGKLDKIFQPFYTTKREGLGMGLSISRSIIDAHGGRLWAENNPDRGATFYCTLPVSEEGGRGVEGRVSRDGK